MRNILFWVADNFAAIFLFGAILFALGTLRTRVVRRLWRDRSQEK